MTMGIKIRELIGQRTLELACVGGKKGLSGKISSSRIQKPGLLLTGLLGDMLHADRVQILGAAEIGYLKSLSERDFKKVLGIFAELKAPALIVTRGLKAPSLLKKFADKEAMPLLSTPLQSSIFIERLIRFLEEKLAPTVLLHGVLVDVLGMGILMTGKSGIGKSECALDLVSRGYRLVADDVVIVKKTYPSILFGMAHVRLPYHIEVRGIGIVNIKDLFGITAIREKKQMDLVVTLVNWDPKGDYERLGFEEKTIDILGVKLPHLTIPVSPGRSVATIVEVAARNQILKIMGHHSDFGMLENLTAPADKAVRLRRSKK